jgi:lipoprotein-anchoring transpeptidase ErfK/SrfK
MIYFASLMKFPIALATFAMAGAAIAEITPVLRAQPLDARDTPQILPPPANERPEGPDAVRLQIFLDEAMFGPGVIDGKPGRFTTQAANSWNERHGHPVDSWLAVNTAARQAVPNPFAVAVVPEVVESWVDATLPTSREGQAKRRRMSYRSVAEFMAERYHTTTDYLVELNGAQVVRGLKPRDTLLVPNVSPFRIEIDVTGAQHERADVLSERYVVVDTKTNQLRIFQSAPRAAIILDAGVDVQITAPVIRPNEALIASFPITPGQERFIQYGAWELRNMVEMPWWRFDQQFLDTGRRSENALNIPPGPNSPIGVIWCGTSRSGIGLHGTDSPETIGRARSAGCIRLSNWDAIRLPTLIRPGATIEIR